MQWSTPSKLSKWDLEVLVRKYCHIWYPKLLPAVKMGPRNLALTMPSCVICSLEVPTDRDLYIQANHDERELTCKQCKKICKGGRNLNTHMKSHREVNCKYCDQTIPYNSSNSQMIKCVGEERAFNMKICLQQSGYVESSRDKQKLSIPMLW